MNALHALWCGYPRLGSCRCGDRLCPDCGHSADWHTGSIEGGCGWCYDDCGCSTPVERIWEVGRYGT